MLMGVCALWDSSIMVFLWQILEFLMFLRSRLESVLLDALSFAPIEIQTLFCMVLMFSSGIPAFLSVCHMIYLFMLVRGSIAGNKHS